MGLRDAVDRLFRRPPVADVKADLEQAEELLNVVSQRAEAVKRERERLASYGRAGMRR